MVNSLHGPRLELRLKPASVLIHMTDPKPPAIIIGRFHVLYLVSQRLLFTGVSPFMLKLNLPCKFSPKCI